MIRSLFPSHAQPNEGGASAGRNRNSLRGHSRSILSRRAAHAPEFRAINPNGKTPAIVDTEGLGDGPVTVFDSNAILLYLAEKSGKLLGRPADRGELLSWLMFVATGLGPYSGQSVHFHRAAPEQIPYAPEPLSAGGRTPLRGVGYASGRAAPSSSGTTTRSPISPPGAGSIAPDFVSWRGPARRIPEYRQMVCRHRGAAGRGKGPCHRQGPHTSSGRWMRRPAATCFQQTTPSPDPTYFKKEVTQ